jgi:arylsulfatase A-like enzyme
MLPTILSQHGYRTGAVVADNPFLDRFSEGFDFFWNGASGGETRLGRLLRLGLQRYTVPVTEVAERAKEWFTNEDEPTFLFTHLMDPHEPYLPGLSRGLSEGVINSYRTLQKFHQDRQSLSESEKKTIRNLYWHCIDYLDAHIHELLSFIPEDAIVVLMGDHGEEFDHGAYRHARLYDECVRVPFLSKNLARKRIEEAPIRQIDLAPTILAELGIETPAMWIGDPVSGDSRRTYLLNHSPHRGESYVGMRTSDEKIVKTFSEGVENEPTTEFFDIQADKYEKNNLYNGSADDKRVRDLESDLDGFLSKKEIREGIQYGTEPDITNGERSEEIVEERLSALGYK